MKLIRIHYIRIHYWMPRQSLSLAKPVKPHNEILIGRNHCDKIISARAHRYFAVLDRARPQPDAAEPARRARQGSHRDLLQRLSRPFPRRRFGLPSGVLAHRHQNDAQFQRPDSARAD